MLIQGATFIPESRVRYLNLKGIDAFVKILSQWRKKEGGRNLDP